MSQLQIEMLTHDEAKALRAPITEFLEPLNLSKASSEIAIACRSLRTAKEREEYLRGKWEGHEGAPRSLKGRPRFEAWLALNLIYNAKSRAGRVDHYSSDDAIRSNLLDVVKDHFAKGYELAETLHNVMFMDAVYESHDRADHPRKRTEAMLRSFVRPKETIFHRTHNDEYGVVWEPVADAIKHPTIRKALNP